MQCPRCGCADLVRVKPTHRAFTLLGRVFWRYSGGLVVCAQCGKELRGDAHGVTQTYAGPQPAAQAETNGPPPPLRRAEPALRDPDQAGKWQRSRR